MKYQQFDTIMLMIDFIIGRTVCAHYDSFGDWEWHCQASRVEVRDEWVDGDGLLVVWLCDRLDHISMDWLVELMDLTALSNDITRVSRRKEALVPQCVDHLWAAGTPDVWRSMKWVKWSSGYRGDSYECVKTQSFSLTLRHLYTPTLMYHLTQEQRTTMRSQRHRKLTEWDHSVRRGPIDKNLRREWLLPFIITHRPLPSAKLLLYAGNTRYFWVLHLLVLFQLFCKFMKATYLECISEKWIL